MFSLFTSGDANGQHLNARFTQGDVVGWAFNAVNNGIPIDLLGASIRMTIAFKEPLVLSTDNGSITITDPFNGQFIVNIPSSQTAEFVPGYYPYDVWIEPQASPPVETQYVNGTIYVTQSISGVP